MTHLRLMSDRQGIQRGLMEVKVPMVATLPDPDALLRQRDAAALLSVSVAWLRASSCPKYLLKGNGPRGRPVVRYRREDVLSWREAGRVGTSVRSREQFAA